MELDEAFKIAVRKFYQGSSHKNVDKYSKNPFQYSFEGLDEVQKSFAVKDDKAVIETEEDEDEEMEVE